MHNAPSSAYRPDIDGLRAFAVLFVVIYHAFPDVLKSGFIGVDIFFVISGYLIGGIILRDLAEGKFRFLHFYARRVLRIFPALSLVLLTVLAAGYFLLFNSEYEMLGKHVFGGAAFVSNLVYYSETGYWDVKSTLKPLLHLWSLGVEEQFYIIIPIVLAVAWKKKYRLSAVIAVLFIASFALNIHYHRSRQSLDFYMPFTRFWEIFMGVALVALPERAAPLLARVKSFRAGAAKDDWRYARCLLSLLGVACIAISLFEASNRNFPGYRALWPTFGAVFIMAAGGQAWLNRKILSNRLAVGIGLISYPLYLWHWPILSFAMILNGPACTPTRWFRIRLFCVAMSLVAAFLTYALVERPVRFGKSGRRTKIFALSVLMACVGFGGLYVFLAAPSLKRSYIGPYQTVLDTLQEAGALEVIPPYKDDSILQYISEDEANGLEFARYQDAGGKQTVAIIGDSHTPPIFQGMMDINRRLGINTVMLEYSPLTYRESTLNLIKNKKDISDVFLVMRGMMYLSENDTDGMRFEILDEHNVFEKFKPWLQGLVDELRGSGKRVYILGENPVFSAYPLLGMGRPFNLRIPLGVHLGLGKTFAAWWRGLDEAGEPAAAAGEAEVSANEVIAREKVYSHQQEYLDILSEIRGAKIINGIDFFCPDNTCSMFLEDGTPLYYDDDHLSSYGGKYFVENMLEPYLSEIAGREGGRQ